MTGPLFAAGLCLAVVVVVVGFAPFLLPWPLRLRWMIVTAMADPWTARASPLTLEECRIDSVQVSDAGLLLLICGTDGPATELFQVPTVTSSDRDQLDQWRANRTPLLMDSRAGGAVTLSGPTGSITAFPHHDPDDPIPSAEPDEPTLGELTLDDLILLGRV